MAGPIKTWTKFLSLVPTIIGLYLKKIPLKQAIEAFLQSYLGDMSVDELYKLGESFAQEKIPHFLYPKAMERLKWHQEQGHVCYVVTASLGYWTQAWVEAHDMKLIAALPLEENGIFKGKFAEHTYGELKVKRLEAALEGQNIVYKYAYGNSGGDEAMLRWADEGYYRPFE